MPDAAHDTDDAAHPPGQGPETRSGDASENHRDDSASQSSGPLAKPARHLLPKSARMPAGGPYARVFQDRKTVSDALVTIHVRPNGLGWHRLGLGVAKKMFRKAVARNRAKRLIREAFRLERPEFGGGLDLVIRPKVRELTLADLRRSIRSLVRKAERKYVPNAETQAHNAPGNDGTGA